MKIISYSFNQGGAAIAAKKFAELAQERLGIETELYSVKSGPSIHLIKRLISYCLLKLQKDHNEIKHSLNLFTYRPILKILTEQKKEVFHIHWINNDTLSIFDFDKIPTGSIITLHDEWLYCGSEHLETDSQSKDFINGYRFFKKGTSGVNWNFIVWKIKLNKLSERKDLIYTTPSYWMQERASMSKILKNAKVCYLPNPINTDVFSPQNSLQVQEFKKSIGVSDQNILIVFGAYSGRRNKQKGGDQLRQALRLLKKKLPFAVTNKIRLLIFGDNVSHSGQFEGFDSIELGKISDSSIMATIFSAADVVVVPSLMESFGQVAAEASSCASPVVCFDTSGLKDIVKEAKTGFLAAPHDSESLANKIRAVLEMSNHERECMGKAGREHVIQNFGYEKVATKYAEIVNQAKKSKNSLK